jgi:putative tricarboxylic transport membrane protein
VAFAATGVGEVTESAEAGDVRILAVTSEEAVEGVDAPTLTDEGVDLVFSNWRGIVAPPGLSDDDTQKWIDAVTEMHDSEAWTTTLEDQGWVDAFMTGDDFGSFLDEESARVESVMSELGLV